MPDDYYVSQYSGEEIDALLGGAGAGNVRYDTTQTLTDAQKTQARNNISAMQGIESTDHPGCYYVLNGSAVEWINPPMQLGIEYRTTERYFGKPVYCGLVDFGSLPNATSKTVYLNNNSSIVISAVGITSYDVLLLGTSENEHAATLKVRNKRITIQTINDQTSYTATILVKYYKGTD